MGNRITSQLKEKISILSQLANVDGDFDIAELAFIYNVCLRNEVEVSSIAEIICDPDPVISLEELTRNEQAEYLTDILLLMMIDGKVLPKEIQFGLEIGRCLGFDPQSIRLLIDELCFHTNLDERFVRERVDLLSKI